jgi:hypothetical protein
MASDKNTIKKEKLVLVAEPPELYGPHVPVIVLQTYDYCTWEPDKSESLSGVLGKLKSST